MKLMEIYPEQNLETMELKDFIRNINLSKLNKLIDEAENYNDSSLYSKIQEIVIVEKQKEIIKKEGY